MRVDAIEIEKAAVIEAVIETGIECQKCQS
jgi:hypothetical protein